MIDVRNIEDYKKKGECIAITSYCNTQSKIDILVKTIQNVKQYGLPIFLHAHYPVPNYIQSTVDFYFYSSDNPIFNRFNTFWGEVNGQYRMEITEYDFFYTTIKGWRESIKTMNEYEKIHIINYDTNLYPELFNISKEHDKSIFLEHNFRGTKDVTHIFLLYFCLKKDQYDDFTNKTTIDEYLDFWRKSPGQFIPPIEEMLGTIVENNDHTYVVPSDSYDLMKMLEYDVSTDARLSFDNITSVNGMNIFLGQHNGTAHLLCYGMNSPVRITVRKLGIDYIEKEINETTMIDLRIPFNAKEIVTIYINGYPVEKEVIERFYRLEGKITLI